MSSGSACQCTPCVKQGAARKRPEDPESAMTPHDWLILIAACSQAPTTPAMGLELDRMRDKCTVRYNAAIEGRCMP